MDNAPAEAQNGTPNSFMHPGASVPIVITQPQQHVIGFPYPYQYPQYQMTHIPPHVQYPFQGPVHMPIQMPMSMQPMQPMPVSMQMAIQPLHTQQTHTPVAVPLGFEQHSFPHQAFFTSMFYPPVVPYSSPYPNIALNMSSAAGYPGIPNDASQQIQYPTNQLMYTQIPSYHPVAYPFVTPHPPGNVIYSAPDPSLVLESQELEPDENYEVLEVQAQETVVGGPSSNPDIVIQSFQSPVPAQGVSEPNPGKARKTKRRLSQLISEPPLSSLMSPTLGNISQDIQDPFEDSYLVCGDLNSGTATAQRAQKSQKLLISPLQPSPLSGELTQYEADPLSHAFSDLQQDHPHSENVGNQSTADLHLYPVPIPHHDAPLSSQADSQRAVVVNEFSVPPAFPTSVAYPHQGIPSYGYAYHAYAPIVQQGYPPVPIMPMHSQVQFYPSYSFQSGAPTQMVHMATQPVDPAPSNEIEEQQPHVLQISQTNESSLDEAQGEEENNQDEGDSPGKNTFYSLPISVTRLSRIPSGSVQLELNMTFRSYEDAVESIKSFAESQNFILIKKQSEKIGSVIIRQRFRCSRYGSSTSVIGRIADKGDEKDTSSPYWRKLNFKCNCDWLCAIRYQKRMGLWKITTLRNAHNHVLFHSTTQETNQII